VRNVRLGARRHNVASFGGTARRRIHDQRRVGIESPDAPARFCGVKPAKGTVYDIAIIGPLAGKTKNLSCSCRPRNFVAIQKGRQWVGGQAARQDTQDQTRRSAGLTRMCTALPDVRHTASWHSSMLQHKKFSARCATRLPGVPGEPYFENHGKRFCEGMKASVIYAVLRPKKTRREAG
jgi:hypothetical protein